LTVTFESFGYRESCLSPGAYAEVPSGPTEPLREWMDEKHRFALSKDKVPIVVHLPNGFRDQQQVCVLDHRFYVRSHESFLNRGIFTSQSSSTALQSALP
jgi:hypothetical protein